MKKYKKNFDYLYQAQTYNFEKQIWLFLQFSTSISTYYLYFDLFLKNETNQTFIANMFLHNWKDHGKKILKSFRLYG